MLTSACSLPSTLELISKYQLNTKKSLGQNFLTERDITSKIAEVAGKLSDKNVLEIGPGPASLTREIIARKPKSINVIELDDRLMLLLADAKQYAESSGVKFNIIHGDALKEDITKIATQPRAIIANLPYNVATPLLVKWLKNIADNPKAISSMTLMFQKEVATRIMSEPDSKSYGRLSIISQMLCDVSHCFDVPPEAFLPPPKVTSTVLHFDVLPKPRYSVSFSDLEKIVGAAFAQRRKMLRSTLKSLEVSATELLGMANVNSSKRAENLSLREFATLSEVYRCMLNVDNVE